MGVDVTDVERRDRSAERSALAIARADPSPLGSGAVMWYASLDIPMPASVP